jgi:DNA-binding response OmpR family regulator
MNHRILLVDDDRWWGESHGRILERAGYECVIAGSANSAIEMIDDFVPTAIVLDVMLPGANGLQLLHELQSYDDTHQVPVILCSNLSAIRFQIVALQSYGVRMILDKSTVTPSQLIKAVKAVIV